MKETLAYPWGVKMWIYTALGMGIAESSLKDFFIWAFGDTFPEDTYSESFDYWNKNHSEFRLVKTDNVLESFEKITEIYLKKIGKEDMYKKIKLIDIFKIEKGENNAELQKMRVEKAE